MGIGYKDVTWSSATSAIRIYCGAHERNLPHRDELEYHLAALKRQGQILTWHNNDTLAGVDHQKTSEFYFNSADLHLLLISHYYFSSEPCWSILQKALRRHEAGMAHLVPVIVSPVDYEITPLGKLCVLPRGGRPLTRWSSRDEAFVDIVRGVREIIATLPIQQLRTKRASQKPLQQLHQHDIAYDQIILPVSQSPSNDPSFYQIQGDSFFNQHRYNEALIAYNTAIEMKSDFGLAYRGRARVFDELARIAYEQFKQLAMQSFEMAIELLRYEELKWLAAQSFEMATILDVSQEKKGGLE